MSLPWSLLWIAGLICSSDSSCSPTSYYKSCWIRRFPGLDVDAEESERRGAHVLRVYREESAVSCSRACCLTPNFSCNLAVFHFNTTQDSVNCFHLQCPTLQSCIPHRRGNVILYNVTKGVDPDLLVFGKHFTTNVRVLPHLSSSRLNISEPLTSDKRHFNYPPNPPIPPISPSTKKPTTPQTTRTVPTTHEVQQNLLLCTTIPDTTAQSTTEAAISTTSQAKMDSTLNPQQTTATPQWESTSLHQTIQTDKSDTTTDTLNQTPSPVYTTTAHPSYTIDYFDSTLTSIPINDPSTIQQPLGLQSTTRQTTNSLATASQNATPSFTKTLISPQQPLTQTTPHVSSQFTSANLEDYQQSTVPTTLFETVTTQTNASSQSETTSANVPPQTSTKITTEYKTTQATISPSLTENTTLTTSHLKMDSTLSPQQMTATPQLTTTYPQTSTHTIPTYETSKRTSTQSTTLSHTKRTTSTDKRTLKISTPTSPTTTTDSTTPRQLTLSFSHTRMGNSTTTSIPSSSLTAPTSSMMDSQPYPNDTKGYISRNLTTGDAPRPGGDGSLTSVWHLAANTVLVALATCATVTFCCCCSVFMALSWRGRRRRKGRYRTNLRGKRGSMRLIKYVIVRESS